MTAESVPSDLAEIPKNQQTTVMDMAAEAHVPVKVVADAYRHELTELKRTARITQYLPVIATRRVRRRLRKQPRARSDTTDSSS